MIERETPPNRCQEPAVYGIEIRHLRHPIHHSSWRVCRRHLIAVMEALRPGGAVLSMFRLASGNYLCDNTADPANPPDPWQTPQVPAAPLPSPETPPTASDGMCDRCRAAAAFCVLLGDGGVLLLCAHHTTQHRAALEAKGALITER